MPDQSTAVAMRLAKELDSLGLVYRWDSVARALDDAGVREAVEALKMISRTSTVDTNWYKYRAEEALTAACSAVLDAQEPA